MAIDVRVTDTNITARSERVLFVCDRASLRCSVQSTDGSRQLAGFRPRARLGSRVQEPLTLEGHRVDPVETALGDATALTLCFATRGPLTLELCVELGDEWPGLVLELAARNSGERTVRVDALEPVSWRRRHGEIAVPGAADGLHFFRMGYQSWSPAGYSRLGERERRSRLPLIRTIHYGPFTPPARRGWIVSDFVTELRGASEPGLVLGFLSHRRFLSHVALRQRGGRPEELVASLSTERRALAPGERLGGERLWIGVDPRGGAVGHGDALADWALRCGIEMNAPVPADVGSGWCSWYQYSTRVRADHVRENARILAELEAPVETIQIDDGFQAAVGDWLEWSEGFPDGVAPLAREIREHGFRAGLWLAPLLVSRASRLAREHPDWIVRGRFGRPRLANLNPAWKGRVCYALDPTHPEVLDWLRELGRSVRGMGFDYLKLDFLYAGTIRGRRHDPEIPTAEAYRGAIAALREGAGPGVLLLGCGAPLGPSVGLFEAMRIGPDVAPVWCSRWLDRVFGIRAAPSAENSLRNILARASLHQRLWLNDPDCVLLRERDTRLSENEVRALAGAIAASGGQVVLSDDLERLGAGRRRLLRRLLPPLGRAPEPGPLRAGLPEGLLQRWPDGTGLVYRVNLEAGARLVEIDLEALGFPGSVHVYDVWSGCFLGPHQGRLRFDAVPPRGSLLLRLAPDDGVARVLGSDLHLSGGGLETQAIRTTRNGGASLSLCLPGPRSGQLLVGLPGREPLSVGVGFRDSLELELASAGVGVEESDEIPDR